MQNPEPSHAVEAHPLEIVDIRGTTKMSNTDFELKEEIVKALSNKTVPFTDSRIIRKGGKASEEMLCSLPTMILYDTRGLELFDQITYHEDYYLTNAEIDILKHKSRDIVGKYVRDNDILIELGAGAMRKTKYLLEAIVESKKRITYYAVDLSEDSLRTSLEPLTGLYPIIKFVGLWGTYHDSLDWITKKHGGENNKTIYLWLGSSIGNLNREQAAEFLKKFCDEGMHDGDLFLCGIDRRNSFEDISLAYNDRSGITRNFSLNGLNHINQLFGFTLMDPRKFEHVSIYNEIAGRHEAYFESLEDQRIIAEKPNCDVTLQKGQLISFEYSYKYSPEEVSALVDYSGLKQLGKLTDKSNRYDMHIFYKSPFSFRSFEKQNYGILPKLEAWDSIWNATETFFTKIISKEKQLNKPISLRHPYIFYMGHLPAFMDIQISRAVGEPLLPPEKYSRIFERGIDPLVENPSVCHAHSEVPAVWPEFDDILEYRERVINRIKTILSRPNSKRIERVLNMCYEHEAMHLETLLYMYVQDPAINVHPLMPIPIMQIPDPIPSATWIAIKAGQVTLGIDDCESNDFNEDEKELNFGWDNEYPQVVKQVEQFKIQHRPVTVAEYFAFLETRNFECELVPLSWTKINNSWFVKTVHGLVSFEYSLNWPVYCSHSQASTYAASKNAKLPTEEQIMYIRTVMNADLGVNHSFAYLSPQNVVPSSDKVTDLVGNGWELTSSILEPFPGYKVSTLYPGYTADFFDGKHYVVLGASWATVPRIARRATFRNWYQSKYPFVFSKFRLVSE